MKPSFRFCILAGMMAVFLVLGVKSYVQENNVFDEEYHLVRGVLPLRTGDFSASHFHPPLVNMLNALPIAFDPKFLTTGYFPPGPTRNIQLVKFATFPMIFRNRMDSEKILYSCRFVSLLFALAAGLVIYAWSCSRNGPASALIPLALFLFDPNVMAHARLVTTDIGVTFFYGLAGFLFWRWLGAKHSRPRFLLAALGLGLAQLSKYSALLLYPAFFLATFMHDYATNQKVSPGPRILSSLVRSLGYCSLMSLFSMVVVFAGWGFQPANWFEDIMVFFWRTGKTLKESVPVYWAGQIYHQRLWYLPFAIFFVKTPIPVLILLGASIAGLFRSRRDVRDRVVIYLFPVIFFLASFVSPKYEQWRYYLPLYPFLYLIVADWVSGAPQIWKKALIAVMLLWFAAEHAMIYPHYLAYFNQFAGGPRNGHRYLLESNSDWGQDLKRLGKFMKDRGIRAISLAYAGRGDPLKYLPFCKVLPSGRFSLLEFFKRNGIMPAAPQPPTGWIVVSANLLHGFYLPESSRDLYKALREIPPTERIGYTLFAYYVEKQPAVDGGSVPPG